MRTLHLRNVPDDVVDRLERLARCKHFVTAVAIRELDAATRRVDNASLVATLTDLRVSAEAVMGSVALRRQANSRSVDPDAARHALNVWKRIGLIRYASTPILDRTWELHESVTAYRAMYVALAENLGCALVTADAQLAGAHGPRCAVTVIPDWQGFDGQAADAGVVGVSGVEAGLECSGRSRFKAAAQEQF